MGFLINEVIGTVAISSIFLNDYLPGCGKSYSWPISSYGCGSYLELANFGNYLFWILVVFGALNLIRYFKTKKV